MWTFLAIAAQQVAKAKAVPLVATHLAGWRRACDFGYVAEEDGRAIGAAWARQFTLDEEPTFYVDDNTPEISIGVSETMRSNGVGKTLLDALIEEANRREVGLCLNIRVSIPRCGSMNELDFGGFVGPKSEIGGRDIVRHGSGA